MPNNRETTNLSNLENISVESINAANAIDSSIVLTASYCLICGEFLSVKHQGHAFCICDDCKNTIKFMKEVRKRLIERKGKCNEPK